jgi:hypothetical protein
VANRLYSVGNSSRQGMFIVAANENRALEIAQQFGHIKQPWNGRIRDITDAYMTSINEMPTLLQGPEGQVAKQLGVGWRIVREASPAGID